MSSGGKSSYSRAPSTVPTTTEDNESKSEYSTKGFSTDSKISLSRAPSAAPSSAMYINMNVNNEWSDTETDDEERDNLDEQKNIESELNDTNLTTENKIKLSNQLFQLRLNYSEKKMNKLVKSSVMNDAILTFMRILQPDETRKSLLNAGQHIPIDDNGKMHKKFQENLEKFILTGGHNCRALKINRSKMSFAINLFVSNILEELDKEDCDFEKIIQHLDIVCKGMKLNSYGVAQFFNKQIDQHDSGISRMRKFGPFYVELYYEQRLDSSSWTINRFVLVRDDCCCLDLEQEKIANQKWPDLDILRHSKFTNWYENFAKQMLNCYFSGNIVHLTDLFALLAFLQNHFDPMLSICQGRQSYRIGGLEVDWPKRTQLEKLGDKIEIMDNDCEGKCSILEGDKLVWRLIVTNHILLLNGGKHILLRLVSNLAKDKVKAINVFCVDKNIEFLTASSYDTEKRIYKLNNGKFNQEEFIKANVTRIKKMESITNVSQIDKDFGIIFIIDQLYDHPDIMPNEVSLTFDARAKLEMPKEHGRVKGQFLKDIHELSICACNKYFCYDGTSHEKLELLKGNQMKQHEGAWHELKIEHKDVFPTNAHKSRRFTLNFLMLKNKASIIQHFCYKSEFY